MKVHGKYSSAFNFILSKYKFRFNVVIGEYEFKKKKSKNWKKFSDRVRNNIVMELLSEQLDPPMNKIDAFIESEKISPDYNPFSEYFENLPKWNEKTDYIKKLAKTVPTKEPKRFEEILTRYLVGVIDCLLLDNSSNDVCLVFQSDQGAGKSRWMRKLIPQQFITEYFYEGCVDTKNKDHLLYLSQNWFIHLDELESIRSNDIGALKAYITKRIVTLRKAYGRYKSSMVRRSSFLGSVNDDKFLTDTTGNRRWLVFKVVGNIDYDHNINIDKLWSQVYKLWQDGMRHWFDTEEIKEINKENEKFRQVSLEEELLIRFFKFPNKKTGEYLSASEVIEKISANVPNFNNKLTNIRIGKALAKHSRKKKYKKGVQMYYVEYLGIEHITNTPNPSINLKTKEIDENDQIPF